VGGSEEVLVTVVDAPDGRDLSVVCCGAPSGMPIFLMHGTPGSRNGPRPRAGVLYRLGIRLICYDRPGYGGSAPHPGRSVADAARDVEAIADFLGIKRFGVVGRSGGGPHALACAALLADRVQCAAVLVGLAPWDAVDLNWYSGMTQMNVEQYDVAGTDPEATRARLAQRAELVRKDPESLLRLLHPQLTGPDLRVVNDVAIREQLTGTYAEAVRIRGDGWIDDVLALRSQWQFDPSEIKVPVMLWHGKDDVFSPVDHTYWLAERIDRAEISVQSGAAHFGAVEVLPRVLAWTKDNARSEGVQVQSSHYPVFSG
jgi:pimeloyl-ACP methyl ester carboxylesterase